MLVCKESGAQKVSDFKQQYPRRARTRTAARLMNNIFQFNVNAEINF